MKDIFFYDKSKMILLSLNSLDNQYVSEIAASIDSTYAHAFNLIKKMERFGIVTTSKEGRTKYVKLTAKGGKLAKIILDFERTMRKGVKSGKSARTAPAHGKLERYKDSLGVILGEVKSKKPGEKDAAKYSRVLGRYKSLVTKLRPKDAAGKKQKKEALALIKDIDGGLKKKNSN